MSYIGVGTRYCIIMLVFFPGPAMRAGVVFLVFLEFPNVPIWWWCTARIRQCVPARAAPKSALGCAGNYVAYYIRVC